MIKGEQMTLLKQMGFSKSDIQKAYKVSQQTKTDILDILTGAGNPRPPPNASAAPPAQQRPHPQQQQQSKHTASKNPNQFVYQQLIKSKQSISMDEYDCIYRQNGVSMYGEQEDRREEGIPVALKNVSNCCYLNSLLQMFFLMPKFVEITLSAKPISKEELDQIVPNGIRNKRIFNSFGLLRSLQNLYSNMILTTKKSLDPSEVLKNMVDSLGNKISYGQEKDLSQISLQLISRLQQCVMYTQGYVPQQHLSFWESPQKDAFQSVAPNKSVSPLKDLLFGEKIQITNNNQQAKIQSKFFGILLNPKHESLYRALDQQFHYQIEHQGKISSKDVWITKQPDYLFFFIQRTNYDKHKGVIKVQDKLHFDFTIYIDRYLYKNKHKQQQKNPILLQNNKKRDELKKQINHATSLSNALQAARTHLFAIKNPPIQLPQIAPVQALIANLQKELADTNQTISKLESRQEQYKLKYIILHRGQADSGHYWGYGYMNGGWWRYDINNSKIDQQTMAKQIDNSGVVVYALVYARYEQVFTPSYGLYLAQEDILSLSNSYNQFVPESVRSKILAQNLQRQKLFESKKFAESISLITLQYEQRFRSVNQTVRKYKQTRAKTPLLSNFSAFLRWSTEQPNLIFKLHLVDVTIRSTTKYSLKQMPSQQYKQQLLGSFKQNLSKYSVPERFEMSPAEITKLTDKFKQFLNNIQTVNALNFMFNSINKSAYQQASQYAYFALKKNTKNYLQNVATEYLAILIICLANENKKVPQEYFQQLQRVDKKLCEQLRTVSDVVKGSNRQIAQSISQKCKLDKKREKELYLWPAESKLGENTHDKLSELIRNSLSTVGKYIRVYNKMVSIEGLVKRQDILA